MIIITGTVCNSPGVQTLLSVICHQVLSLATHQWIFLEKEWRRRVTKKGTYRKCEGTSKETELRPRDMMQFLEFGIPRKTISSIRITSSQRILQVLENTALTRQWPWVFCSFSPDNEKPFCITAITWVNWSCTFCLSRILLNPLHHSN